MSSSQFAAEFNLKQEEAHAINRANGFWDKPVEDGTRIALMHSELTELLEGLRHDNPPSDHIPQFCSAEEELADVIIRAMDLAHAKQGNYILNSLMP